MKDSPKLKKELALFGVFALATGATLSSGFFLLPGIAAAQAGPAVTLSYLLAAIPILPGILCKIELATAMPRAGGEYYFIDRSLGPLFGTIGGIGTWLGLVLKTSFALIGMGAYVSVFRADLPVTEIAVGIAILLGIVNLFGAHKSGTVQSILVIALLLLLGVFVIAGVPRVQPDHFQNLFRSGWESILATAGMVCISYMGLTKVASVAEEVRDPEKNMTRGILLALAVALVAYGVGTAIMVGVLPLEDLTHSLTPVADAAERMLGHGGALVMATAACLAFLSVANAGVLSASRYPLAMSRDHLLPAWFRRLNAYRTPHRGVFVTVATILLFVTVLDATKIAKLASAFLLLLFGLNCLAVVVMRESRIASYDPGFRVPAYPWLPLAGILAPILLVILMGWLPLLFCFAVIVVGSVWYVYYARRRIHRGGAIIHLFARWGEQRYQGLDRELRGILKEKGLRAGDPYEQVVADAHVLDADGCDDFQCIVHAASERLARDLSVPPDVLAKGFLDGTHVGATPVSRGVALPHLRLEDIDRPHLLLARARHGVFVDSAPDFVEHSSHQAIYVLIFLVSPDRDPGQHLRVLANIAQQIDPDFVPRCLEMEGEQQLRETLMNGRNVPLE